MKVAKKGIIIFMDKFKERLVNLLFPALMFGAITGVITALVIILYKFIAKYVIEFSQDAYGFLRSNLHFIPLVLLAFFLISLLFANIYKKQPRVRGGGIPSSIALLRGIVTFEWLRSLVGVFFMSMTSFLIGVPLGNEGPSVLMGTAVGKGSVSVLAKKHPVWSKYSMTGGACAGFAVATGAPISGILFAIEEAHQRISPMILIVASVAVLFAQIISETLCPLLGLSTSLFPDLSITTLAIKDIWIPLVVGVAIGLFAVLFLKYYQIISKFFTEKLKNVKDYLKIFVVFILTLIFGLISFSFVSTGHETFSLLLERKTAIYGLVILLLVRMSLTLFANTNKLTGGVFLPIIALGAILASILGTSMETVLGLSSDYYTTIIVIGVASCISAMMKMPLTAIVFSLEVFGCTFNVLYIIVAVIVSYIISELCGAKGINDSILKNLVKAQEETHTRKVVDTHITIKKGSFAENMHEKDILWPTNFFVLSITPSQSRQAVDKQYEKTFHEGDVLHIRYDTFDDSQTKAEIIAIVGEQEFNDTQSIVD